MVVQFLDFQDPTNPLNGARIDNRKELLEVLDGLRSREPFLCELVGENGYRLIIGIGDEIGCVQYSNDDVPYLLAVAPGKHREEEYVEFLSGNTPTPIPKRNILPFDVVKEIAGYFIETGKRSPAVSWEEV